MLQLAQDGYTEQQVKDALHGKYGSRDIRFKYHLLDSKDKFKKELKTVAGGSIDFASLATIKRTAKFSIQHDAEIDFLKDRIQPYFEIRMPKTHNWLSYPLGVFLLKSPVQTDNYNKVWHDVEAYDKSVILIDDKVTSRYTVDAGTNYQTALIDLLTSAGITKHNIETTDKTLPVAREWEIGTEKLTIFNDLCGEINYTSLVVDANGFFTSKKYESPENRAIEYTYEDNSLSIIRPGVEKELDLWEVPNVWLAVVSNEEQPPLVSLYENDNGLNPTSITNLGRRNVRLLEVDKIADQESLNSYVERIAHNASQVYGKSVFETAIMPHHDYLNVLQLKYSPQGIDDKYTETRWSLPLKAGAMMKHECRVVVSLG